MDQAKRNGISCVNILWLIIDHNVKNLPKPHHVNRDLVHVALEMERQNEQRS